MNYSHATKKIARAMDLVLSEFRQCEREEVFDYVDDEATLGDLNGARACLAPSMQLVTTTKREEVKRIFSRFTGLKNHIPA